MASPLLYGQSKITNESIIYSSDAHFDNQGYNAISGYEYSLDDFKMRNEILKNPNPNWELYS